MMFSLFAAAAMASSECSGTYVNSCTSCTFNGKCIWYKGSECITKDVASSEYGAHGASALKKMIDGSSKACGRSARGGSTPSGGEVTCDETDNFKVGDVCCPASRTQWSSDWMTAEKCCATDIVNMDGSCSEARSVQDFDDESELLERLERLLEDLVHN